MKERVPIPDSLAAKVMFASDRTCCVCRLEKHKVQIHHIDGNPGNNSFDNLSVICLYCHSDAHTNGAFVRNLTPELLRLYNTSWRKIVEFRLSPPPDTPGRLELASEVFLEASLDCHRWKIHFMSLMGGPLLEGTPREFQDVWDAMAELWVPKYTEETYGRFKPLFVDGIGTVRQRIDRLMQLFSGIIPFDFQSVLLRTHRQLELEQSMYLQLPNFVAGGLINQDTVGNFFYARFAEVIRVLRSLSRDADSRRENLHCREVAEQAVPADRGEERRSG